MIAFSLLPVCSDAAVLMVEHFNYTAPGIIGQPNSAWTQFESSSIPAAATTSGSLSHSGLGGTSGGKLQVHHTNGADGQDLQVPFGPVSGDGNSVFISFILRKGSSNPLPATIAYPLTMGFASDHATTVGDVAASFVMITETMVLDPSPPGLFAKWGTSEDLLSSTGPQVYPGEGLIILELQFVAGAANDVLRLWINPTLGLNSPPPATAVVSHPGGALGEPSNLGKLILFKRPLPGFDMPIEVDEIRIGTTWTDVSSATVPAKLSMFIVD